MKIDIRMAGLGGQGIVTAAALLGMAAVNDGKYSVVVPFFGAEKRLAPTESYIRISSEKIHERGEVSFPDIIVIFHPEVITKDKSFTMPFYSGFRRNGCLIINSKTSLLSEKDKHALGDLNTKVIHLPASQVAREIAGTELATNMAMIGGIVGATQVVTMEAIEKALFQRFGGQKFIASATTAVLDEALRQKYSETKDLVDKNMASIRKAFEITNQLA